MKRAHSSSVDRNPGAYGYRRSGKRLAGKSKLGSAFRSNRRRCQPEQARLRTDALSRRGGIDKRSGPLLTIGPLIRSLW